MSDLTKCPGCGREAQKSFTSNWFPVHTCRDCRKSTAMNVAAMENVRSVVQAVTQIMTKYILSKLAISLLHKLVPASLR